MAQYIVASFLLAFVCVVSTFQLRNVAFVTPDGFYYRIGLSSGIKTLPFRNLTAVDDFNVTDFRVGYPYRMGVMWINKSRFLGFISRRSKFRLSLRDADGNIVTLARLQQRRWYKRQTHVPYTLRESFDMRFVGRHAYDFLIQNNLKSTLRKPIIYLVSFLFTFAKPVQNVRLIAEFQIGSFLTRFPATFKSVAFDVKDAEPLANLHHSGIKHLLSGALFDSPPKKFIWDKAGLLYRIHQGDVSAFMMALRKESVAFLQSLTKSVEQLKHMPLLQSIVAQEQKRIQALVLGPLHGYDVIMSVLYATLTGQLEVLSLLMSRHHESVPPYFVNFVLELAAERRLFDMMAPLLAHYDPHLLKDSPIVSTLIASSKLELALQLITDGVLTESLDQMGQALYLSLEHRAAFLVSDILRTNRLIPNVLIPQEEAILNEVNDMQLSEFYSHALVWAANDSNLNVVATCLKKGANVHIQDDLPLVLAAKSEDWSMIKLLIKAGADMTIKNHLSFFKAFVANQQDVLKIYHTQFQRKKLFSSILVHLADLGDDELLQSALNDTGADVTFHNSEAFKIALAERKPNIIMLFVKYGADVSVNDYQLLYLCQFVPELQHLKEKALGASSHSVEALSKAFCHAVLQNDTAVVDRLVAKGAQPDFQDCACLQRAAAENNLSAVDLLLSRYERVRPNVNSSIAFYYAERNGNQDMNKTLWDKVASKDLVIVWEILHHALVAADSETFKHVAERSAFDFRRIPKEQLERAIVTSIKSYSSTLGRHFLDAYNPLSVNWSFLVAAFDALARANFKLFVENVENEDKEEMADMREELSERFSLDSDNRFTNATLEYIVKTGRFWLATYLLRHDLASGETLLTLAARFNQPQVAKHIMCYAGVDPTFVHGAFVFAIRNNNQELIDLMRIFASPHWSVAAVAEYAEKNKHETIAELIVEHSWEMGIEMDYAWNNYYWAYRRLKFEKSLPANASHEMLCGVLFWSVAKSSQQWFEITLNRMVKEHAVRNPACANAVYEAELEQREAFVVRLWNAGMDPDWFYAAREYASLVRFFDDNSDEDDNGDVWPLTPRSSPRESDSSRTSIESGFVLGNTKVAHLVLMLAVENEHTEMVNYLVDSGAADPRGLALKKAVSLPETIPGIVNALVLVSDVWENDCESLVRTILSGKFHDEGVIVIRMFDNAKEGPLADWQMVTLAVQEKNVPAFQEYYDPTMSEARRRLFLLLAVEQNSTAIAETVSNDLLTAVPVEVDETWIHTFATACCRSMVLVASRMMYPIPVEQWYNIMRRAAAVAARRGNASLGARLWRFSTQTLRVQREVIGRVSKHRHPMKSFRRFTEALS